MKNIVLIGAGEIGSRHLQGFSKLNQDIQVKITVIDIDKSSIELARKRWEEVKVNTSPEVQFFDDISIINFDVDVAVIATSSNARFEILRNLVNIASVEYIIFEKFLFNRIEQYHKALEILESNAIYAFVNCPRRMYSYYQEIQSELIEDNVPFDFSFKGSGFGLLSNAIHRIDLFAFFVQDTEIDLDISLLKPEFHKSKREGYYELNGRLIARYNNESVLDMYSYQGGNAQNTIFISNQFRRYLISEPGGFYLYSDQETSWQWEKTEFLIPFQSNISHIYLTDLLDNGKCDLTQYKESMDLHLRFINVMKPLFEKGKIMEHNIIPIT